MAVEKNVSVDKPPYLIALDLKKSQLLKFETDIQLLPEGLSYQVRLKEIQDAPLALGIRYPRASGDGKYLFDNVSVNRLDWWSTKETWRSKNMSIPDTRSIFPSHTGRWLALGGLEGIHSIVDRDIGEIVCSLDGDNSSAFFSKDDSLLFLSPSNRIFRVGEWTQPADVLAPVGLRSADFSSDGRLLVLSEVYNQRVAVYSLDQRKNLFEFDVSPNRNRWIRFADTDRRLILALDSEDGVVIETLDFDKLQQEASYRFPGVPFVPDELLGGESLQEKTFDSRVRRSPIQNAIQIRSAEQHSAINLNAIADLWPVESVDVESLLNELQKAKQQRTTRITEQLIGPWERNKTDLFAEKTYVSLAVALANRDGGGFDGSGIHH